MALEFRSGDALFVFDADMNILSWNHAAEELTGISGEDAVGRTCWEVLGGEDEHGSLVCHAGCSGARLAGEGWPVRCQRLFVKTADETRKDVWISTIAVKNGDGPVYVHVMRNGEDAPPEPEPVDPRAARLTPRQLEVLGLIAEGLPAKTIGARLQIAEPTVRNHIRSILLELGCHSQLEALAVARRRGLL